jgi:hypothetical protein
VFIFSILMFPPRRFTSSQLAKRWCVPFNFSPTLFFWTFLIARPASRKCYFIYSFREQKNISWWHNSENA